MGVMRHKITAIAVTVLVFFVILKFPSWSRYINKNRYNIDWLKVIDDPNVHLTYELVETATYEAQMLDSNAYAKNLLEERFNITLN